MAKIRFTSIKPGLVFEHEGVKLKAVESYRKSCSGCCFDFEKDCPDIPCMPYSSIPKQKHNIIFKKVEK